jgi:aminoglycoside 6-adenylyltransferase
MMELILKFAEKDERIRVVGMEGSRTNVKVPKDQFQDYDITYVVTEMDSFTKGDGWLDYFGQRMIMQKPEAMELFPPELGNWFSYLMLFEDGNRIDLTLVPINELELYLTSDKLLTILLDKDGRVPTKPVPTDVDYHVKKPSAQMFDDCCNEFWWVSTYVAKGLCRGEILFAIEHLNNYVRPMLLQMLAWQVGIKTYFSLSVGKAYKYLDQYLGKDDWNQLLATYPNGTPDAVWEALFTCHRLFRKSASDTADRLGFAYPDYDQNVSRYIMRLHRCYFENIKNES